MKPQLFLTVGHDGQMIVIRTPDETEITIPPDLALKLAEQLTRYADILDRYPYANPFIQ